MNPLSDALLLAAGELPDFLVQVVALVLGGAIIAYVAQRFGVVPIVGFLIAGVVIGPNALGLVRDVEVVEVAAEVGVILLLFTIGIEFNLARLVAIRRLIFGGGGLQVALATAAILGILLAFGVDWRAGLFTGFLVALSSTAIVLKLIGDRGEMNAPHGQVGLGLLIFQDLAIVVMALVVPMLAGEGGSALEIVQALATALAIIVAVLLIARRLMPPVLERVARTCSPELFLLAVIAICFTTAYLTSLAGVSVSLGAFLAGLVVSESRFSEHALSEILPLQILFSATFFVSVGMLLDLNFLVDNLPLVLGAVAVVLVVKVITTGLAVRLIGYAAPVAAASALMLAQVGEFSFVLESIGREAGLSPAGLGESGSQTFIAATVLLMVATPLLTATGVKLGARLSPATVRQAAPVPGDEAAVADQEPTDLTGHVIVAGYGQAGRALVAALLQARVEFLVTTLSPGGAEEAEAMGCTVLRGDATQQRTLRLAGLERARTLVIPDDNPAVAERIAAVARTVNPDTTILVRTRYDAEQETFERLGVELVTDERSSSVALSTHVLLANDFSYEDATRYVKQAHDLPVPEFAHAHTDDAPPATLVGIGGAGGNGSGGGLPVPATIDREQLVTLDVDDDACSHMGRTHPVLPSAEGCEECLASGDWWVHLRICMTCGHVGCCDSSPNRHASAHHAQTTHPIVRSGEPGEDWGWCFVDRLTLLPKEPAR